MKLGKETHSLNKPDSVWVRRLAGDVFECFAADNISEVDAPLMGDGQDSAGSVKEYSYSQYFLTQTARSYGELVSSLISLKYSPADEISLMKKYTRNPTDEEYAAYINFVSACKECAQLIYNDGGRQSVEVHKYIPDVYASLLSLCKSSVKAVEEDEEKLEYSGLYDSWAPGKYNVGDVRNADDQTWECFQAHDNATHPDINPDNESTWRTFWRPLHAKSKKLARPWAKPTNATDIYKVGEYMVWTDGHIYCCKQDTNFSPSEYATAWEVTP